MADQVEEVKQKTDIVSLVGEFIDLKKAGRNHKALCPFHSEKTPSFMVSPELQIFKCFGCGEAGDVYAFLQKYEGMDFYESLKFLADRAGIKLKQVGFKDRGVKQTLFEINTLASKFYQYILLGHSAGKKALSYLVKERGLKPDTIKTYQLGYSPETPEAVTKYLVEKKKFSLDDLHQAGLIYRRGTSVIDRFRGRVTFPLHDHRGNIAGFAGRILPDKEKLDLAKYINTPETGVYHKAKLLYGLDKTRADIKKKKEALVVEGELDAISTWQVGVKNVVAIKGSALTENQANLLQRFAERAILALDADIAGDDAARRGIAIAEDAGLEVKVARLGEFKDPDEAARKDPPSLKKSIKDAVGVWDFIIETIFSRHDAGTGPGKAKISREIIPILSSINDLIVQAHYVEVVAKKIGIPTSVVVDQISRAKSSDRKVDRKIAIEQKLKKDRRQLLEERLMSLAFSFNPKMLLDKETFLLIRTPLAKRILEKYKRYSSSVRKFNPSEFAEGLPKELVNGFADMILRDSLGVKLSLSLQKKEFDLVKRELQILNIKDRLVELTKDIHAFEKEDQKRKLKKTQKEFAQLTSKLSSLEEVDRSGIIL